MFGFRLPCARGVDFDDPDSLEEIFMAYVVVKRRLRGFLSKLARRIITISLQKEAPHITEERLAKLFSMAKLSPGLIKLLLRWLKDPTSFTFVTLLAVCTECFMEAYQDEASRLASEAAELVRDKVNYIRHHLPSCVFSRIYEIMSFGSSILVTKN